MHLTNEEIERYRNQELPAVQLLRVREHSDICEECRRKLADRAGDAAVLFAQFSNEPDEQELVLFAAGRLPEARAKELEVHVAACAACREIVEELRGLVPRCVVAMPSRKRGVAVWLGALAAALLLAAVGLNWFRGKTAAPTAAPLVASLHDGAGADPLGRSLAAEALRTGRLTVGAPLPAGEAGTLRGTAAAPAQFELLAPLNRRVVSDRPEFQWSALPGASKYEVTVFTDQEKIVAHGVTSETRWRPDSALPRGIRLGWQVSSVRGNSHVSAPAPPAAPVYFEAIPAEDAAALERALAAAPVSHLELAALYAREGMLDEARSELGLLEAANPGSSMVRGFRDSLSGN